MKKTLLVAMLVAVMGIPVFAQQKRPDPPTPPTLEEATRIINGFHNCFITGNTANLKLYLSKEVIPFWSAVIDNMTEEDKNQHKKEIEGTLRVIKVELIYDAGRNAYFARCYYDPKYNYAPDDLCYEDGKWKV